LTRDGAGVSERRSFPLPRLMTELALDPTERTRPSGRTFFGEPIGLAYLSFTEAWERFSYYGMTALLVLYMTQALFMPGHVENIAGFAALRHALESVFGPMTTLALASQIYGLYTGFVYFTPVFGGLIADRLIGRKIAVAIGAVLMSAGHIAMAFDASFLLALLLLITGCGLLKGNISSQVGALYAEDDANGRTRGFSIFSMGINVGAVAGPLVCGLLAQRYGWHVGFGLAGVLMLMGLVTYLAGYHTLVEPPPSAVRAEARASDGVTNWRVVATLIAVMALTIFHSIGYYENSNIGLVWINQHVDLDLFGFQVPVAWFNSIDPFVSIIFVPILIALWKWQDAHGGEPREIMKISIGAFMACAANVVLFIGCTISDRVSVLYPIAYDFLLGVAFLYYWPTLLALVSRAAPPGLKATLMGVVFLTLFIANIFVGWIGGIYEHVGPAKFWAIEASIAATGGVLALLLNKPLTRQLERGAGTGSSHG
jgi:POT family proton-dependent oligopeptide transporter